MYVAFHSFLILRLLENTSFQLSLPAWRLHSYLQISNINFGDFFLEETLGTGNKRFIKIVLKLTKIIMILIIRNSKNAIAICVTIILKNSETLNQNSGLSR